MTIAIIGLLTAIIGFATRWFVRRWAKRDDPKYQHRQRLNYIERDIIKRSSESATIHGSDDLDELDRLSAIQPKPPPGS